MIGIEGALPSYRPYSASWVIEGVDKPFIRTRYLTLTLARTLSLALALTLTPTLTLPTNH